MKEIDQAGSYLDFAQLEKLRYQARGGDAETTHKAAKMFESVFMQMMLKSMRQANEVFGEDNVLSNDTTKLYQDMFDQQISTEMSNQHGLGLSSVIERQLSNMQIRFQHRDDGYSTHAAEKNKLLPFTMNAKKQE